MFKIKLTIAGKEQVTEGFDAFNALDKLTLPTLLKGKVFLEAIDKGKSTHRMMNHFKLRRILSSDTYKAIFAKQINLFLK